MREIVKGANERLEPTQMKYSKPPRKKRKNGYGKCGTQQRSGRTQVNIGTNREEETLMITRRNAVVPVDVK